MKNNLLSFLLCVSLTLSIKAQVIRMFHENKNQGYVLYADSKEFYPVSLSIELNLSNLDFSEGSKKIFVVPPRSIRYKIGELTTINNRLNSFSYNFRTTLGDVTQKNMIHLSSMIYPSKKARAIKCFRAYNGIFSHQSENALDFTMPEGSEVVAARDGVVVQIVQHNTVACLQEECKKYNNYLIIIHSDKTFAYYGHIRYNGANCKLGDKVKKR